MSIKTVFLSLLALSAAVSVPQTDYDVIVVGGGPAGLSALSGVSRVRRTALLFDSQQYRNAPTREMHDVIGNDGELALLSSRHQAQLECLTSTRHPACYFQRLSSRADFEIRHCAFQE